MDCFGVGSLELPDLANLSWNGKRLNTRLDNNDLFQQSLHCQQSHSCVSKQSSDPFVSVEDVVPYEDNKEGKQVKSV